MMTGKPVFEGVPGQDQPSVADAGVLSLDLEAANDLKARILTLVNGRAVVDSEEPITITFGQLSALLIDLNTASRPSPELSRLVVAARMVCFEGDRSDDAFSELDAASEAFAESVPWDDLPFSAEQSPASNPGTDHKPLKPTPTDNRRET